MRMRVGMIVVVVVVVIVVPSLLGGATLPILAAVHLEHITRSFLDVGWGRRRCQSLGRVPARERGRNRRTRLGTFVERRVCGCEIKLAAIMVMVVPVVRVVTVFLDRLVLRTMVVVVMVVVTVIILRPAVVCLLDLQVAG